MGACGDGAGEWGERGARRTCCSDQMAPSAGVKILLAVAACGAHSGALALQRANIFFVLQDDYGWNDFHGPALLPFHGNLTALAKEGIILTNHLVHYHCSPTRRSFISGRLPIHHGEELSPTIADNVDLRWALVSDKLKHAGYATHWVGKGHTGYESMAHLPTHRSVALLLLPPSWDCRPDAEAD